jgi:hypothetical protein
VTPPVPAPSPSPAYPATDLPDRSSGNGRSRSALPTMPASPVDMGRGATIPVPPPESTRGPLLPPSLDTGRLGPSPRPNDTGQIPAVSASSLPPDLSWAADDNEAAVAPPLSSPFAGLGPSALDTGPLSAPGRLLASPPHRQPAPPMPSAQVAMPPAQALPPSNGRHEGDPAAHVTAMSTDARAAVEATVGRSGGGPGGMPMSGVTPDQMMSRGQLLDFLSSVR